MRDTWARQRFVSTYTNSPTDTQIDTQGEDSLAAVATSGAGASKQVVGSVDGGSSQPVGFNQLFGSDSRFVINGSSLQIRAPSKRHDESLYLCARRSSVESIVQPEVAETPASDELDLASASASSLHQSSSCRRLLSSLVRVSGDEEATAALQLSSISIRIVGK